MIKYEDVYRENQDFIFRFLVKLSGDVSLAEELCQETFYRAYINFASLRNEQQVSSWLCTIAKNTYFAWQSENKKKTLISENLESDTPDVAETFAMVDAPKPKNGYRRISQWKASLIQAVMLFVSFGIIAVGVIFEGNTPFGDMNGLWSVALIIPATGYLLSMANTFFVRMYKSRKSFSNASVVINTALILMGYAWAFFHYEQGFSFDSVYVLVGIGLSLAFCVLSKVISSRYALLMGKE